MNNVNSNIRTDIGRRSFLKTAAAGTAVLTSGVWSELSAQESNSPNEKLQILCVGTGNRAAVNLSGIESQSIVAICDVDREYLDRAASRFTGAKKYVDYREMIDKEAAGADAILISTADHNHAPAAMRAINAGLHCYCEKPLSHTIREARLLAEAASSKHVVTQMGTQIHASNNYRRVVELIRAGVIGSVTEVHVWVNKAWGGGERPTDVQKPPSSLDWDLWLGPAPERSYSIGRYHPGQWRKWWDFGQGTLGDMGCHYIDLPFWALDLRHPIACDAEGESPHPETCPLGLKVNYEFPARDDRPAVKLTWYDGNLVPTEVYGETVPGSGVMFVGDEGHMFADYNQFRLYPTDKFSEFAPPAPSIPESIGHYAEWIKACKDGSKTTCNFDYSGALTETILLGNVAYRAGKPLQWDAATLTATNCPEASQYIDKDYRPGWEVEFTG